MSCGNRLWLALARRPRTMLGTGSVSSCGRRSRGGSVCVCGDLAALGAWVSASSCPVRLASTISSWTSWDSAPSPSEPSIASSESPASARTVTSMPSTASTSSACGHFSLHLGLTGFSCKFILACENSDLCCHCCRRRMHQEPIHFLFFCILW